MVKRLTARQEEALINRYPSGVFLYADHPDGELRMWSGAGVLISDNQVWIGASGILRIEGLEQETGFTQNEIRISLSWIPNEMAIGIDTDIDGRRADVYFGFLDAQGMVIDGLIPTMSCTMDRAVLSADAQANGVSMTYTAFGNTGLINLNLPSRLLWSTETQKFLYPDIEDTGFDAIYALQNKRISWVPGPRRQ